MCSHERSCNAHKIAVSSVCQTLDELSFERGIWPSAMDGDIEKLKEKLNKGIDPSLCDSSGYTALHYAARNGREEACALLLERGANVNAQTHGGATPLLRAASQGHKNIINLLIKYKADLCICDSDGRTALHKAAEGKHSEVAKLLVDLIPELKTMKDNKGHTPVFYVDSHCMDLIDKLSV